MALGQIRPEVIVLVPPIDRMKEYGSDWKPYGDYIFNEVLPAVRKATGASERPEDVFMGGSSMGGLISLRLAEEYPTQLAGGIQCQSAAVQWSPGEIDFSDVMKPDKLKQMASTTRIWLDWGTLEDGLTPANVKLTQVLDSIHRPYGSRVTHEGHNWTAWRNRMQSGLTYILGDQPASLIPGGVSPTTGREASCRGPSLSNVALALSTKGRGQGEGFIRRRASGASFTVWARRAARRQSLYAERIESSPRRRHGGHRSADSRELMCQGHVERDLPHPGPLPQWARERTCRACGDA